MRKSNEQSIKEVIREIVGENRMGDKLSEVNVIAHWEEIVGSLIARQTEKIYIHKRILFLHISSPPLRTELTYTRSKLLEVINAWAQQSVVDEIIIK